jgi:competence protein ComEA
MKQIIPASVENESSAPDRVYNDAMENSSPSSARFTWLILLILIPIIYGIFSLGAWSQNHTPLPPPTGPYENKETAPAQGKVIVHVVGAVKKPGVYTLPMDARIYEALQKAGGALPSGDPNQLNLAAWAEDGSRIEVPFKAKQVSREDVTAAPLVTIAKPPAETISETPSEKTELTKAPVKMAQATTQTRQTKPAPSHKINLNKATIEELTLLPGIGPATAEKIIAYRQTNGAFSSVDDLDNIKGIGEKKLEKVRPFVTVQ